MSGRAFRPVVRERTIFGHVEARRVTTFDYLLARGDDVFLVEATGWQTAQGLAPAFGTDTPFTAVGLQGRKAIVVGSIRALFEDYFGRTCRAAAARTAVARYAELSTALWDGMARGGSGCARLGCHSRGRLSWRSGPCWHGG